MGFFSVKLIKRVNNFNIKQCLLTYAAKHIIFEKNDKKLNEHLGQSSKVTAHCLHGKHVSSCSLFTNALNLKGFEVLKLL